MLFYIMVNQWYEYAYVQAHVSAELPMRYIFSAFWEGQEGSFLLWMFWHIILGLILIRKAGEWESGVLMFLALAQAVINSMLLGIHFEIGDTLIKFGSNPTLLLRDTFSGPIFEKADYLVSISGTGLNPLLQNYWMTIHPPTLFLGFASTTIPFAFAMAGLFTKKYTTWLKPVLPWALFSAGILGVGILMGGAWAYEALSFGGYWAWDPVENMSLVPWIILIAGVHTNLIARTTGRAIKSTYIYYTLCFCLILYSTYLTRSGILGDTSAHAFTEMGLEPQLIFLVTVFAVLSLILYIMRSKFIPTFKKEESILSREFWMFVGALVLLFSGGIIAFSTSLPVYNAIATLWDPEFVGTVIKDPIPHYNKFQIWIGVLVSVLSANTIFLRYKTENMSGSKKIAFAKSQIFYALLGIILTGLLSLWLDYFHWKYALLTFCASYTIIANLLYLISVGRMNMKMASATLSHIGFGIMIIGVIASGLNEGTLTTNPFVMKGLIKDEDLAKSVKLIKDEPFYVNNYWLTYESDTVIDKTRTFKVKFEKEDSLLGNIDPFYVYPNILYANDFSKVAASNPATKHYLHKDIFTNVAALPKSQQDIKYMKEEEDSLKYVTYTLSIGDTLFTKKNYGILTYTTFDPTNKDYDNASNDLGLGVGINFYNLDKTDTFQIEPAIGLKENMLYQYPQKINDIGVKIRLNEQTFDNYFSGEDDLVYTEIELKKGESFDYQGETFQLLGFEKEFTDPNYPAKENDIAIQALLVNSNDQLLKPIYIIRDSKPFNIKDYLAGTGVHARLVSINPVNETFTFNLAKDKRTKEVVVDIAENVPRSDFIVLEARVFPGINLFWIGSCLMMLGFFLAFWQRRITRNA